MGVGFEAGNRGVDERVVFAEDRTVGGEQVFDLALADSFQAADVVGKVRSVVGIDHPDATISKNIVAGEEEIIHPESELAGGVSRGAPNLQGSVADHQPIPLVDRSIDLAPEYECPGLRFGHR